MEIKSKSLKNPQKQNNALCIEGTRWFANLFITPNAQGELLQNFYQARKGQTRFSGLPKPSIYTGHHSFLVC